MYVSLLKTQWNTVTPFKFVAVKVSGFNIIRFFSTQIKVGTLCVKEHQGPSGFKIGDKNSLKNICLKTKLKKAQPFNFTILRHSRN